MALAYRNMALFVPEDVQLVILRMSSELSFRATVETISNMREAIVADILRRSTDRFHATVDPGVAKLNKTSILAVHSNLVKLRWLLSKHNTTGIGLKALAAIAIQKDIDFIYR